MRYHCNFCGKSVTSELPDDTVIRAIVVCPECLSAGKVVIPERHIPFGTVSPEPESN